MKKKIIIFVALSILVVLVVGFSQYNKPHREIASEKANFSISANDLFDAFDEDEKAANAKYLDKVIEVSGTVKAFDNFNDVMDMVFLEAENAMIGGVMCMVKDKNSKINIADQLTLKCRCTGFLDDVVLVDCSIVNK